MLFNDPFPGILIGSTRGSSIPREGWHHPQAGTARRLTLRAPAGAPILRRTRSSGDPACPRAPASSSRLSSHSRKSLGFQEPPPPPPPPGRRRLPGGGGRSLTRRGWGAPPWAARSRSRSRSRARRPVATVTPARGARGRAARSGKMASARSRGAQ